MATNNKTKRNKNQLVTAISVLLLMILLESMYYGYHIMDNRTNLMAQYESEQKQRTELLSHALRGMDEAQMAEFIEESVDTSASSWAFVTKDGKAVFMRDESTTAEQAGISPESYADNGDAIVTTADVGDGYVCGIITLKSYIWQSVSVNDFEFYIIIAVIADFMVFGGMLVQFAGKTRTAYDELEELESELAVRNEKFHEYEKLTARYEDELAQLQPAQDEKRRGDYYDMDVVDALLSKSDDASLYPITYMFIRIDMEDRYYTRDEIFAIMDFIKAHMDKRHVTAEISKAYFAVIMYRTDADDAERVKQRLLADWESVDAACSGTGLGIRSYSLEQGDSPLKVFYREMERI